VAIPSESGEAESAAHTWYHGIKVFTGIKKIPQKQQESGASLSFGGFFL